MPDKTKREIHQDKVKEFKDKVDVEKKVTKSDIIEQIASRDLLERDYKEDTLEVIFKSSTSTTRKIVSHKPTPEQMRQLMRLQAEAMFYETQIPDKENVEKLSSIYDKFAELAASLTTDKKLDKEFWNSRTSTQALGDFINKLMILVFQGPLSEGELEKFR